MYRGGEDEKENGPRGARVGWVCPSFSTPKHVYEVRSMMDEIKRVDCLVSVIAILALYIVLFAKLRLNDLLSSTNT